MVRHLGIRKRLLPILLLISSFAAGAGLTAFLYENENKSSDTPENRLYDAAMMDAAFAEEDEIMPLVCLTKEENRVTWDEEGERVLLLTWHSYPEFYAAGETVKADFNSIWAFTDGEMSERYAKEAGSVTDWTLRLKQLMGFPPDSTPSSISGLWVRPEDVIRPAYQPDPTKDEMYTQLHGNEDKEFAAWFHESLETYFFVGLPWTRLGYTYDWADNGTEYGLTTFLVKQGAEVEVAFTETTDAFLSRLAADN